MLNEQIHSDADHNNLLAADLLPPPASSPPSVVVVDVDVGVADVDAAHVSHTLHTHHQVTSSEDATYSSEQPLDYLSPPRATYMRI